MSEFPYEETSTMEETGLPTGLHAVLGTFFVFLVVCGFVGVLIELSK